MHSRKDFQGRRTGDTSSTWKLHATDDDMREVILTLKIASEDGEQACLYIVGTIYKKISIYEEMPSYHNHT